MRMIIEYLKSCFCKHDWEIIFNVQVESAWEEKHTPVKLTKN